MHSIFDQSKEKERAGNNRNSLFKRDRGVPTKDGNGTGTFSFLRAKSPGIDRRFGRKTKRDV